MTIRTRRGIKLTVIVSVLLTFVGSVGASQAGILPFASGSMEQDFWRWTILQGGLFLALVIVLWNYRKDLVGTLAEERDREKLLVELVERSTTASNKAAAASEANERAVSRLAQALENWRVASRD